MPVKKSKSVPAKAARTKSSKPKGKAVKSPKKAPVSKKPAPKKAVAKKSPAKKAPASAKAKPNKNPVKKPAVIPVVSKRKSPLKLKGFLAQQHQKLLDLKDSLLDSMQEVARDSLRKHAEGSEANAFGQHQADAGSDAYDRDFALSMLSREQDSLYEIDEALKRVEAGSYGVCEMSGKQIPKARLEALPFTRYTVECQAELEKQNRHRIRQPVTSLFGLSDDDGDDDDDSSSDSKD
jgi:DnaK suppressor protein